MWPYYVYELADPDTGQAFYVGKGKGARMYQHLTEARKGVCSNKCNKIREITSRGLAVELRQVAFFNDEAEAYKFEAQRIREYGLDNLTNISPAYTPPERDRQRKFFKNPFVMRVLALGLKYQAGLLPIPTAPYASAVHKAFMRRFPNMMWAAHSKMSEEELHAGLLPYGVRYASTAA